MPIECSVTLTLSRMKCISVETKNAKVTTREIHYMVRSELPFLHHSAYLQKHYDMYYLKIPASSSFLISGF